MKASSWINKLEDFNDPDNLSKPICVFNINYPPFEGLTIEVTEYKGKQAIVFYTPFFKIYCPKKIEYSFKRDGRRAILCIKTDKCWVYDEIIAGFIRTTNFGIDMTMPFLKEQEWNELL